MYYRPRTLKIIEYSNKDEFLMVPATIVVVNQRGCQTYTQLTAVQSNRGYKWLMSQVCSPQSKRP